MHDPGIEQRLADRFLPGHLVFRLRRASRMSDEGQVRRVSELVRAIGKVTDVQVYEIELANRLLVAQETLSIREPDTGYLDVVRRLVEIREALAIRRRYPDEGEDHAE
jgi:hypothetical protein